MRIELTPHPPGAFTHEFAAKKKWKVDEGLLNAMLRCIPEGATVLDMGAGVGKYVQALRDAGRPANGCDGIQGIEEMSNGLVHQVDLSIVREWTTVYDWVISIEVCEHIPPEMDPCYFANLVRAAMHGIIVSVAVPGQRGRDHINCHLPEYVVSCILACREDSGWDFNEQLTLDARNLAGKGWDRKLLVFTRS